MKMFSSKSKFKTISLLTGLGLSAILVANNAHANTPKTFTKQEQADLMAKGMWYDERTGLIWSRCSVGQAWNGTTCVGEIKKYRSFTEAKQVAESYSLGGYKDWKLPTVPEFHSLENCKKTHENYTYSATYDKDGIDVKYINCVSDDLIGQNDKTDQAPLSFISSGVVLSNTTHNPRTYWSSSDYWSSSFYDRNYVITPYFVRHKDASNATSISIGHLAGINGQLNVGQPLLLVNDTYYLGEQTIKNILLSRKNKDDRTLVEQKRVEVERERKATEQARKDKEAYDRKVANFRKNLKVGDDASAGIVIEIKGDLIKIQTNDTQCSQRDYNGNCKNWIKTPVEKWVKRSNLYP